MAASLKMSRDVNCQYILTWILWEEKYFSLRHLTKQWVGELGSFPAAGSIGHGGKGWYRIPEASSFYRKS